jgi:hypothetical protein
MNVARNIGNIPAMIANFDMYRLLLMNQREVTGPAWYSGIDHRRHVDEATDSDANHHLKHYRPCCPGAAAISDLGVP